MSKGSAHSASPSTRVVADYFACSANGDPLLGEASLSTIGKTRDLSDTSMRCPNDIGGEGHHDGVINRQPRLEPSGAIRA